MRLKAAPRPSLKKKAAQPKDFAKWSLLDLLDLAESEADQFNLDLAAKAQKRLFGKLCHVKQPDGDTTGYYLAQLIVALRMALWACDEIDDTHYIIPEAA